MRCPGEVLVTKARFQASSLTYPLLDFFSRIRSAMRKMVHSQGQSVSVKLAACPSPLPLEPSPRINSPSSPDDDPLDQSHFLLVQSLRPSLSSICNWLEKDDVHIVGGQPIGAGGFADIWRGSLDSRQVAIKSYRRYLFFDLSQVFRVG